MPNKPEQEALPPIDLGCDWEDWANARIRSLAKDRNISQVYACVALVAELGQRESELVEALSSLAKAEEERDEALECRNLIVAGTVRDASYPSGWRNFRAEKAEERNRELILKYNKDTEKLDYDYHMALNRAEAAESELSRLREENRWVRRCVNPDHLEAVTQKVNMERAPKEVKSHCKNGHEYTPENSWFAKNGWRECRICRVASMARYHAKHSQKGQL